METDIQKDNLTKEDTKEDLGVDNVRSLMVYNDDHNTFEHVIDTLIKVCRHDALQAEQCTLLIHYRGKCAVKKGIYEQLKPMKEQIIAAGIKSSIV